MRRLRSVNAGSVVVERHGSPKAPLFFRIPDGRVEVVVFRGFGVVGSGDLKPLHVESTGQM